MPETSQAMVNKVSGHKPGSITMVNQSVVDPGGHPPATGWAGTQFNLMLYDTNGKPFPGVQIQELFVPNDPPEVGFTTKEHPVSGPQIGPWVTQDSPAGQSATYDMLTYPWHGTDQATRVFVHHYWAATAADQYGTGGIDMGAYTMTFTCGTPGPRRRHIRRRIE